MLTAMFGEAPATHETSGLIRIEAAVPTSLPEASRLDLLAFLYRTADRFGHCLDRDGTSHIWAEVDRELLPPNSAGPEPDESEGKT